MIEVSCFVVVIFECFFVGYFWVKNDEKWIEKGMVGCMGGRSWVGVCCCEEMGVHLGVFFGRKRASKLWWHFFGALFVDYWWVCWYLYCTLVLYRICVDYVNIKGVNSVRYISIFSTIWENAFFGFAQSTINRDGKERFQGGGIDKGGMELLRHLWSCIYAISGRYISPKVRGHQGGRRRTCRCDQQVFVGGSEICEGYWGRLSHHIVIYPNTQR